MTRWFLFASIAVGLAAAQSPVATPPATLPASVVINVGPAKITCNTMVSPWQCSATATPTATVNTSGVVITCNTMVSPWQCSATATPTATVNTSGVVAGTPKAPTDTNIIAGGISYNSPHVAGSAVYAHYVTTTGKMEIYSFSVGDAVPSGTLHSIRLSTEIGTGLAEHIISFGKYGLYIPETAGPSFSGSSTGWQWSSGALIDVPVGRKGFHLFPNARVVKDNTGLGYAVIAGLWFGAGFK